MSVLVVGSVAYDDIETPAGKRARALGGSATYFSAASSLFSQTSLVAVVGEDFDPEHLAQLSRRNVDTSGLKVEAGRTFRWGGRYSADFNERTTLFTELNVFEKFSPELPAAYRRCRYVFLANIDPELQLHVLSQVENPSFVAFDTMNYWIEGPKRGALDRLLARVDGVVVNDEEVRLLTGESSVLKAAHGVMRRGPKTVIVKRGEHGALILTSGEYFYATAYPLEEVVDPTGAGDTFAGGFMGWLARAGKTDPGAIRQAAVAGTLTASFCVEGFGTERLQSLELGDVARRYARHLDYTRCPGLDLADTDSTRGEA
jgi:sugar/nucleoside kinase (ribokinase family)